MERIWPGDFVDEANLTQNIYVLRRLFEEHRSGVRIDNVPKRGYRLAAIAPPQAPQTPIPLIAAPPSARRTGPLARLVPVAAAVAIAALLSRLRRLLAATQSVRPPRARRCSIICSAKTICARGRRCGSRAARRRSQR